MLLHGMYNPATLWGLDFQNTWVILHWEPVQVKENILHTSDDFFALNQTMR